VDRAHLRVRGHRRSARRSNMGAGRPRGRGDALLATGGGDAWLARWRDVTQEEERAKAKECEATARWEQTLEDHVRRKEHGKALELALRLDRPRGTLRVLQELLEEPGGGAILAKLVRDWSMETVVKLLQQAHDWNTRARNCAVATAVVEAVMGAVPAHILAREDEVAALLAGIVPYAERHFSRVDGLKGRSYLLDWVLRSMEKLEPLGVGGDGKKEEWEQRISNTFLVPPPKRVAMDTSGGAVKKMKVMEEEAPSSDEEVFSIGDSDSDSDAAE